MSLHPKSMLRMEDRVFNRYFGWGILLTECCMGSPLLVRWEKPPSKDITQSHVAQWKLSRTRD